MFNRVSITNFKSVKHLAFVPNRVNVFIGEPNSGKSNLLEALAFLSDGVYDPKTFKETFRIKRTTDLFFDREVQGPIEIRTDRYAFSLRFEPPKAFAARIAQEKKTLRLIKLSNNGPEPYHAVKDPGLGVGYYRFKSPGKDQALGRLWPPYGGNLAAIISSRKDLRQFVNDLFRSRGFRLQLDPVELEMAVGKDLPDQLLRFPYESFSETLRRVVFYHAAIETNQNAVLLLDEPEANTFPFYTKFLAERVALATSNQFFLATHNPYVLSAIVEKTPVQDLGVFITRMSEFQTVLRVVTREGLSQILDFGSSVFFNLDRLLTDDSLSRMQA